MKLLHCISSCGWGSIQSMGRMSRNSQRKKISHVCYWWTFPKGSIYLMCWVSHAHVFIFFHRNIVRSYGDIRVHILHLFSSWSWRWKSRDDIQALLTQYDDFMKKQYWHNRDDDLASNIDSVCNEVGCLRDPLFVMKGWLNLGNKQRATAATGMNDKSSRSHSVFTLVMTQTQVRSLFFLYFFSSFKRNHIGRNKLTANVLFGRCRFYFPLIFCPVWVGGRRGARAQHHQQDQPGGPCGQRAL